ncbi:carboxypeptidase regulatory-like domain-containing protein [Candidatus Woesearchaeota archaeon]|nr:carboxypeptidase regulatory-like domain-containing protein [Candidatus Woesearchaeota archaeon]
MRTKERIWIVYVLAVLLFTFMASAMDPEFIIPNTGDEQFYHGQTGDEELGVFMGGGYVPAGDDTTPSGDGGSPLVLKAGFIVVCGNGNCQTGETCAKCPQDCGVCQPEEPVPPPVSPPAPQKDITGDAVKDDHIAECGDSICSLDEGCAGCAKDCGSCSLPVLVIDAPSEIRIGDLMTIIITDDAGSPVSGAEIVMIYPSGRKDSFVTDKDGMYSTKSKEKGQILLNAKKAGYQVSKQGLTVREMEKELLVPRFFEAVKGMDWLWVLLAVVIVAGMLGFYIYSYRSRAHKEIGEIDKKLDEMMKD